MINENGRRATLLRVDPRAPGLRARMTTAPGEIDSTMNERNAEFAALRAHYDEAQIFEILLPFSL